MLYCKPCIELFSIEPIQPPIRKLRYNAKRKRRLVKNGGSHTDEEWLDLLVRHANRCVDCHINADDTKLGYLTKDHILPVSKGGTDFISNIQPMCLPCNFRKNNKLS
jgi:5-methylcytosine-specific restriction endonuclease McrA